MNEDEHWLKRYKTMEREKNTHCTRSFLYSGLGLSALYLGVASNIFITRASGILLLSIGVAHGLVASDAKALQQREFEDTITRLEDYANQHK